jgi:pilus assembly protein Flp/PilA
MNEPLTKLQLLAAAFIKDGGGAQVIEYALIIAVVSLVIVTVLPGLGSSLPSVFASVKKCLAGTCP